MASMLRVSRAGVRACLRLSRTMQRGGSTNMLPQWSAMRMASTTVPAMNIGVAEPHASESFMTGTNSVYMEEMYRQWKSDPSSVHTSWNVFFTNVDKGMIPGAAFLPPPTIQSNVRPVSEGAMTDAQMDHVRALHLIRAFQVRGHEMCNLDPLGVHEPEAVPELDYKTYGFTEDDLNRELDFAGFAEFTGFLGPHANSKITLGKLMERLTETYSSNIGYEYMHINSREVCNWIRQNIERVPKPLSKENKLQIFDRLAFAEQFEKFLGIKYGSHKRFGLDGLESLIPGMKAMLDRGTSLGLTHCVLGMPHRGRLNVLTNVIRKPAEEVFSAFDDIHSAMELEDPDWNGSGDVKYHLGTSFDRTYSDGRKIHLSLMPNPSHLEAVNPVVVGKVRAIQDELKDEGERVMGVLLHGDAAFAGQGVVYETLHMAKLRNYATGGTIHIVCNNQIGFTTNPEDSRSSRHPSDVAKAFEVPVFHVNADDVEAVCHVFELAAKFRAEFNADCVIDLVGYRRFGHNEGDQPMFTQPKMYNAIKKHPSALTLYTRKLMEDPEIASDEVDALQMRADSILKDAFDRRHEVKKHEDWLEQNWSGLKAPRDFSPVRTTGVALATLKEIGALVSSIPEGFSVQGTLKRQLVNKAKNIEEGNGIDWGTAEALAFGSVLKEGDRVRLSGQDVERGTFSHRHSKWHDQKTNELYFPLAKLGNITICNSPLSEFGVLGYEFGYSLHSPHQLNIWEAQFGDFANGAQVIIDQFLSASERKWYRMSGLVMLLPHGYDGGGPEHSSARIERYLQAVDEEEYAMPQMHEDVRNQIQMANWQVVNCTTPANYFHALRRQVQRDFRKPMIVAAPKSLLRHPRCVSDLADMAEGTKFKRVLIDKSAASQNAADVNTLVFCSGKVYYDLIEKREAEERYDVAIARVEQLAPFPFDLVAAEVAKYPNAKVAWCQEEPRNMGPWHYVRSRITTSCRESDLPAFDPIYIGRDASASTSTGSSSIHKMEQEELVNHAFNVNDDQYVLTKH